MFIDKFKQLSYLSNFDVIFFSSILSLHHSYPDLVALVFWFHMSDRFYTSCELAPFMRAASFLELGSEYWGGFVTPRGGFCYECWTCMSYGNVRTKDTCWTHSTTCSICFIQFKFGTYRDIARTHSGILKTHQEHL